MPNDFNATIEHLKHAVHKMLDERVALQAAQPMVNPSLFWASALRQFQYVLDMPPEKFQNIRSHSVWINPQPRQELPYPGPYSQEEIDRVVSRIRYSDAVAGVPADYWIGEPSEPGFSPWQQGVIYHGKLVNTSLVRYQECVSNLYHIGALQSLLVAPKRQTIVEIGGGYGALAHSLGLILKGKVTYIIIDVPEMLLYQGAYLAQNNPDQSMYIYDSDSFTTEFGEREREREAYDFILVPNFALRKLNSLQDISLLINMGSLAELTESQVDEYLCFAQKRISGYLYTDDVDRDPNNTELRSLVVVLERYFDLFPDRRFYDGLFQGQPNSKNRPYALSRRKHFGVPKGSGRTIPSVPIVIEPSGFRKEMRAIRLIRSLFPLRGWQLRKILLWRVIRPLIPMYLRRLFYRVLYD
jgi:hypothetical protein